MKIFAEIGGTGQLIGDYDEVPDGYIEVLEMRPGNDYIGAVVDGVGQWAYKKPVLKMSSLEFTSRFTPAELVAIYTHAESNIAVKIWIDQVMGADFVVLDNTTLLEGMAYMVFQGLMTQSRYDEILDI